MNTETSDTNHWCKYCRYRASDTNGQIICSINWKKPSFIGFCPAYVQDTAIFNDRKQLLNAQTAAVSLWIRLIIWMIDLICIWFFGILMGMVLGMLSVGFSFTELWQNMHYFILYPVYFISYYVLFELSWSRTIGKLVCACIVVDLSGRRPTFKQIIIRSLCRLIPIDPFTFFGKRSTGWHDTLSNTRVIYIKVLRKARQKN